MKRRALEAAVERFRRTPIVGPALTDSDLYDEQGLPIAGGDFSKTDIEPVVRPPTEKGESPR
jgi:hypothetical protein